MKFDEEYTITILPLFPSAHQMYHPIKLLAVEFINGISQWTLCTPTTNDFQTYVHEVHAFSKLNDSLNIEKPLLTQLNKNYESMSFVKSPIQLF